MSCVSIYGMISKKIGSQASFPMGLGLSFLWQCITNYNNNDDAEIFPVSFDDVLDAFLSSGNGDAKMNFPPVQFLVGDKDPLLQDSLCVYNKMKSNHYKYTTELHVYQGGFHGFFGVPPDWQLGRWKLACRPCSEDLYAFLNTHTIEPRNTKISLMGQRTIGDDWFGVIVISQLVIVMPFVIVCGLCFRLFCLLLCLPMPFPLLLHYNCTVVQFQDQHEIQHL